MPKLKHMGFSLPAGNRWEVNKDEGIATTPGLAPHSSYCQALLPDRAVTEHLKKTVEVDTSSDSLYILDRNGYLYTSPVPDTASSDPLLEKIGYVGPGRPLGYHIHPHTGHLIICDSLKGLTQYKLETKELQILANQDDNGIPITYANDLDISEKTGDIYFTDSTKIPPALNREGFYDTMMSYVLTAMQGQGTGRLLVYSPDASPASASPPTSNRDSSKESLSSSTGGTARVLVDGLYFANGTKSVLIDSLPGYPDGISRVVADTTSPDSVDAFWIAIIVGDSPILKAVYKGGKNARWLASWLLQVIPPPVKPFGMVMKVSGDGEVLQVYKDPKGKIISGISGVQEVDNKLWMGHLTGNYVSYLEL
ncbi:hypothetical protein KSW81_002683 [Nannochloris sp. 'desiccata']|nr:hypothetical protein KSW81_002683 [Chlorella desiccata (nom. nud.)]